LLETRKLDLEVIPFQGPEYPMRRSLISSPKRPLLGSRTERRFINWAMQITATVVKLSIRPSNNLSKHLIVELVSCEVSQMIKLSCRCEITYHTRPRYLKNLLGSGSEHPYVADLSANLFRLEPDKIRHPKGVGSGRDTLLNR
jgi:hypothetical protein